MVLQPPLVLDDTMRANIALGRPDATQREIERAASAARLDPVIAKLPAGLDESRRPGRPQPLRGRSAARHDRARPTERTPRS